MLDRALWLLMTFSFLAFLVVGVLHWNRPIAVSSSDTVFIQSSDWVECDAAVFDFGKVTSTHPGTHVFLLKNQSNGPVKVVDVKSSCGCLVPRTEMIGQSIMPGQSLAAPVLVDWNATSGAFVNQVRLTFAGEFGADKTSSQTQVLELTVKGEVEPILVCDPPSVNFGLIDQPQTRLIRFFRTDGVPFTEVHIDTTNPLVQAKLLGAQANECQIELIASPELVHGNSRLHASVNFQVPDLVGRNQFLFVPVQGEYLGPELSCYPQRMVLGRKRQEQRFRVRLGNNVAGNVQWVLSGSLKNFIAISEPERLSEGHFQYVLSCSPAGSQPNERGDFVEGQLTVSVGPHAIEVPIIFVE